MALSDAEQYLLELINRARLDPMAEARRFGIDLNQGLTAGQLNGAAKQVLAPDAQLETAATAHSQWMLNTDTFSHTGVNGSNPGTRMTSAGYVFSGPNQRWAENIAWAGTTGTLDPDAAITQHYDGLFLSSGHRVNTLGAELAEIGIGQVTGTFSAGGRSYNASMLTENFAHTGTAVHVTGVIYADRNANAFYSIGEGLAGLRVTAAGQTTTSAAAGGYDLAVAAGAAVAVSLAQGSTTLAQLTLDLTDGNGKLDLIAAATGGWSLGLSASAVLQSGVAAARLLGVADLNLTGHAGANVLTGNAGDNRLAGMAGNDVLSGGAGNDRLIDGTGSDVLIGGAGKDTFVLQADGAYDRIADFTLGQDRIDLSGWTGLTAISQLTLLTTSTGLSIRFGAESLLVQTAAGSAVSPAALGVDDLINLALTGGTPVSGTVSGTGSLIGTALSDILQGTVSADYMSGYAGSDRLTGGDGSDGISGGVGNDTINADLGNDRIIGGAGADRMNGGAGMDRFIYLAVADSVATVAGRDMIAGFYHGSDRIDLSAIDANPFVSGNQAFTFIGAEGFAASGASAAAQLHWSGAGASGIIVAADLNGDGTADMQILLTGIAAVTAADFIL